MERWRLISTWGAPPALNMGLDEALLEQAGAPPTLRFYTWEPDTLSLGYFQRYADVRGTESAGAVVRRITGGGAIHHANELTFSIAVSLEHPLYAGPVADSYERVHATIARTLREYGVGAAARGGGSATSDRPDTGMCFHRSTAQDLVWGGRKGVGSAQRRRDGRVLHHGSIKLASTPLEGEIATLSEGGRPVSPDELARALGDRFARELGLRLTPDEPTPVERERAALLGARYVDPAFVRRR